MKLRSMSYLSGEGVRNMWSNRTMSIASVGVLAACMIVMGIAMILSAHADLAVNNLAQQNVALVEIDDISVVDDPAAQEIYKTIQSTENVEEAIYISSQDAFDQLQLMLGDQYSAISEYVGDDPTFLPRCIQVTFKTTQGTDYTDSITDIKNIPGVVNVSTSSGVTEKINSIQRVIAQGGFWVIMLLAVVSLVIVMNTIRITMSNRRREISIMKAVGATNGFIRLPFLIEGMIIGAIACVVSLLLLYFMYSSAVNLLSTSSGFTFIPFSNLLFDLIKVFVVLGIGAGLLGSTVSITRYLKKEGSSFSELS